MIDTMAQVIGFGGAVLNFASFQQKTRRKILGVQIAAAILFIIHYILLGAYTGAALNAIALSRSTIYFNSDKKWAKSPVWLVLFVVISGAAGLMTWEGWYSFLPPLAMILTTISYWLKNETKIRLVTFPSSPCWLGYNIITGSVAGVVTECIVMTSLLIAIFRYDILGKRKNNEN